MLLIFVVGGPTEYRFPRATIHGMLTMTCSTPLDFFKLSSVGGFITALWRTRRAMNIAGMPMGSALGTDEERKAPKIEKTMACRCVKGCGIRNDTMGVGGPQRYTGRYVIMNLTSDVVKRVRVSRQLGILTPTTTQTILLFVSQAISPGINLI